MDRKIRSLLSKKRYQQLGSHGMENPLGRNAFYEVLYRPPEPGVNAVWSPARHNWSRSDSIAQNRTDPLRPDFKSKKHLFCASDVCFGTLILPIVMPHVFVFEGI